MKLTLDEIENCRPTPEFKKKCLLVDELPPIKEIKEFSFEVEPEEKRKNLFYQFKLEFKKPKYFEHDPSIGRRLVAPNENIENISIEENSLQLEKKLDPEILKKMKKFNFS